MKSAGTPNEVGGVAKNAVADDTLDGGTVVLACGFACTSRHVASKATSSTPTRNIAGMSDQVRCIYGLRMCQSILDTFEIRHNMNNVVSCSIPHCAMNPSSMGVGNLKLVLGPRCLQVQARTLGEISGMKK